MEGDGAAGDGSAQPLGLDRMSLNTISVRNAPIADVVAACGKAGVGGVGVWRHQVAEAGAKAIRQQCDDAGLRITSLCRGGFFPADSASERAAQIDDTRQAVDEAAELGADVLVVVSGPVAQRSIEASRRMVSDALAAVVPYAAERGVAVGLEPLHPMFAADRSVVVTLGEANDLIEALGHRVLRLIVDVYHCWWDTRVHDEIGRAAGRIGGFHISDWVPPRGDPLVCRALPGDGCIDIRGLRRSVERAGFTGLIEVEVMNTALWQRPLADALVVLCERFAAFG